MSLTDTFDSSLTELSGGSAAGKRYLLAVSGGMDSMCMADLFLNSRRHPAFGMAHVNFSLRGDESDGDEELVRSWAESHAIEFHTIRFDTSAYAGEHSLSIEMAARELRYSWFETLIEQYRYDFLAIAHNRNDSVETLFINLLRGSGINGITGIRRLNGKIIRPLSGITRKEISEYISTHSVPYRDDSTNFGTDYSRNKIRNLIFPILETINPSFLETIARDMEHFRQAADILDETFGGIKRELISDINEASVIDRKALTGTGHPDYYAFRLLTPFGFNSAQIQDILSSSASGHTFTSPSHVLITDRDTLKVYPLSETIPVPISIDAPGILAFGNLKITLELRPITSDFDPHPTRGTLFFDATDLKYPLTCRSWHEGDRFRPFGMKGSRKVSDFFTTLKLDLRTKNQQPIMCDASGRIICIPPHRIDDRFRLTSSTRTVGVVSVQETDGIRPLVEQKVQN